MRAAGNSVTISYMQILSTQDIEYIAGLARLSLTKEEKKRYAEQLSAVFDYISQLSEVDTDGVEETCQVTGLTDVTRLDEVVPCDEETKLKLVAVFPEHVGQLLKVPGVFDDNSESRK